MLKHKKNISDLLSLEHAKQKSLLSFEGFAKFDLAGLSRTTNVQKPGVC